MLTFFCGSCARVFVPTRVLHVNSAVLFSFSNPVAIPHRQEKERQVHVAVGKLGFKQHASFYVLV
jgi:hypothetical protein